MFGFIEMMGNYESRKLERFEGGPGFTVDTCRVTDSSKPFETGIKHPEYNGGEWVIVELYDTPEEAREGHAKWVTLMTGEELPESLFDVNAEGEGSEIGTLAFSLSGDSGTRPRVKP